jgi:hypothetical protein
MLCSINEWYIQVELNLIKWTILSITATLHVIIILETMQLTSLLLIYAYLNNSASPCLSIFHFVQCSYNLIFPAQTYFWNGINSDAQCSRRVTSTGIRVERSHWGHNMYVEAYTYTTILPQFVLLFAQWKAEEHRSLNHAGTFLISIWQETAFHAR